MTRHDPRWLLDESWRQVQRAGALEDRARALATFRRTITTAIRHSGASPDLLNRVNQLESAAQQLYDEHQDEHVRKAVRALASLRMAVEARLNAGAAQRLVGFGNAVFDADELERKYQISPGTRTPERTISVQMAFRGSPTVTVYGPRGGVVWTNAT